jgi:hypothetical protein
MVDRPMESKRRARLIAIVVLFVGSAYFWFQALGVPSDMLFPESRDRLVAFYTALAIFGFVFGCVGVYATLRTKQDNS